MAKSLDMTTGKPLGLMVRFAVPMMLCNIFQLLYTVADSAVVGRLIGVQAFAAVGAAGFSYWLVFDTVLGLTQGFGTLISQRFGAKDETGLRRAVAMAALLSIFFGIIFSALGALFSRPLLMLLNTPTAILDGAATYMHIMVGGMLITFVYNLLGTILRSLGDSKTPLIAMLLSSAINIAIDVPLVIFTPAGIAGVAISTVFSQICACLFCLKSLRSIESIHVTRSDFRIDWDTIWQLLRLGAPAGLRNFIISLGGLLIQYAVNGYGVLFVAGVEAPKKVYALMEIIGGAMDGAVAVFVAQNFGARRLDRVQSGVRSARRVLLISACAIAGIAVVFGKSIMGLMLPSDAQEVAEVLHIAQNQLIVMAIALPTLYMLFLYRSALSGMGNALMPMASGFIELLMRVVSVLLLPIWIGEWGIYLAVSLGWPVAALQLYIAYVVVYKATCRKLCVEVSI